MNPNALRIKKLSIKNFRSIVEASEIELDDLNVIVGSNDQGKSNILRALNLFFNHSRPSVNTNHIFQQDFCLFANVGKNKAKQIVVELTIQPPLSYQQGRLVKWKKVWRADGYHAEKEQIVYEDGEPLPSKSRLPSLFRAARYEYVPAIKGPDYFAQLLGDLHDMLALTVEDKMRDAAKSFTATINTHTEDILEQLQARLGFASSIQLPPDLRELFSRLDFASLKGGKQMSLQQRGDGIKVRHIPIVLQFLAAQANLKPVKGKPPVYTIWGYEEPENNLELSKAVEVAKEFQSYSDDVQILLTTHSPAFYSLCRQPERPVKLISVTATETKQTIIQPIDSSHLEEIDTRMGLISFVAPYLERAMAEKTALQARLDIIAQQDKPTLFVEGNIDKQVLTRAMQLIRPSLLTSINIQTEDNGGANYVKDMLIMWSHSGSKHKAIGLFDDDEAGRRAIIEASKIEKLKVSPLVKWLKSQRTQHLDALKRKGYEIDVRLEELFAPLCWIEANTKKWLEKRPTISVKNESQVSELNFTTPITLSGLTAEELVFVQGQICEDKKWQFANHVCNLNDTKGKLAFAGFERTLKKVEEHLLPTAVTVA